MRRTSIFLLISFVMLTAPAIASENEKIEKAIEFLKAACVTKGGRTEITAKGKAGLTIKNLSNAGVEGELSFAEEEVEGLAVALQKETASQATEMRECMKPYINKILDKIFDYSSDIPIDWVSVAGIWEFKQHIHFAQGVRGYNKAYDSSSEFHDGTYEVTFRKTSSNDGPLGILLRYDDSNDVGYMFLLWPHGGYQFSIVAGEKRSWIASADPHPAINKGGSWNTVKIAVTGSTFDIWINSVKVAAFEDGTISSGKIGLVLHGGPKNTAEYKNLVSSSK